MSVHPGSRAALTSATVALCIGLSASSAGATPSEADDDLEAAQWYRRCMHLADSDPQRAFDLAEARIEAAGGPSPGHCAAVALVRLERFAAGATRFEELAAVSERLDLRAALLDQAAGAWLLDGNAERAVRLLEAAVEIAPNDANLRVDKAAAEAELGRYAEAVRELDHAIGLDPDFADAYAFRASAKRRLAQMDDAAADLQRALTLDPRHPEALLERGILRQLRDEASGARADWEQVIAIAPDSPAAEAARINLAALDRNGR